MSCRCGSFYSTGTYTDVLTDGLIILASKSNFYVAHFEIHVELIQNSRSFTICLLLFQLVSDVILLNFRYHYLALYCVPQNRSVITGDPVKLA